MKIRTSHQLHQIRLMWHFEKPYHDLESGLLKMLSPYTTQRALRLVKIITLHITTKYLSDSLALSRIQWGSIALGWHWLIFRSYRLLESNIAAVCADFSLESNIAAVCGDFSLESNIAAVCSDFALLFCSSC